jgi:hypothetical protein
LKRVSTLSIQPFSCIFPLPSSDEAALTAEQLQALIDYLPTSEEITSLKAYIGNDSDLKSEKISSLCECEKFMVAMMNVRFSKNKIRCLMFKQQFSSLLEQLDNGTYTRDQALLLIFMC